MMTDLVQEVIREVCARVLAQPAILDLTPAEIQVICRLGRGMTYSQIRRDLGLKSQTDVANRIGAIVRRTGVNKHRLMVYGAFLSLSLGEQWANQK